MVKIQTTYEGALRVRAVHEPTGSELLTDAPKDNNGKGEAFSPTDLIGTSLASCMLTIMGMLADRKGWAFEGATIEVEKHMVKDPDRRIAKLDVIVRVPHVHEAKVRKALERAAMSCPVHKTLGDRVEMPIRFEWAEA